MAEEIIDKTTSEGIKTEEEMTTDELKALHDAEDFIINFKEEDKEDPEKVERLDQALKNAKTTIHQKNHYRAKYTEATKKAGEAAASATPVAPAKPADESKRKELDAIAVLTFKQDHPELTREQANEILEHASAYGISAEKALEKPMIKKWIKDSNNSSDVEDGTPQPARRAGGSIAEKDWTNASKEEMDAARARIMHPNG